MTIYSNGTEDKSGLPTEGTIHDAALRELRNLESQLTDPEEGNEGTVAHGAHEKYRTESYLAAYGGPHAEVYYVWTMDGELDTCFLLYLEASGRATVHVPDTLALQLLAGFRAYDKKYGQ